MVRALVMAGLLLGGCNGKSKDERTAPAPAPTSQTAPSAVDAAVPPADEVTALVERGIRPLGAERFEVDPGLLAALWATPERFTGGARLERRADGLLLQGVWPRSVYARLGLANGDLLVSLDGRRLSDLHPTEDDVRAVQERPLSTLEVMRDGRRLTFQYQLFVPTPPGSSAPPPPPPPPPPPSSDAAQAYDRGDYDAAIAAALIELQQRPDNVRLLRILVSSYCATGDAPHARLFWRKLPSFDQVQMQRRCTKYGIDF